MTAYALMLDLISYKDPDRWIKEAKAEAVLLDIDTDGEDAFGGLPSSAQQY
jgi:hypothetical protein